MDRGIKTPKIIMPFLVQNGMGIHSDKIFGGIERFKKLIYQNIPNVIPVDITKQERRNRTGKGNFHFEMWNNTPDIIFINDMSNVYGSDLIRYDLPIVWICHEPLERSIMMVEMIKRFDEFTNKGGHLYFVSQKQFEFFDENSIRLLGHPIKNVKGFVNPACCLGTEKLFDGNREFDAVTIGRNLSSKDPFWIHRKLESTNLSSAVMTSSINTSKKPVEIKYFNDNQKWQSPQHTFRELPHEEVLYTMSKGGVYASTWPLESWGITALEALSHGLPLVLVSDSTGKHASETIAASSDHYLCVPKGIKPKELEEIINDMNKITLTDRQNIARMTQDKHSLDNFKQTFTKVFENAL
jgi:hypothetical protein